MLVTLQQASDHVRRDTDEDDANLLVYIEAASEAVLNYIDDYSFLNSAGDVEYDSAGEPLVPKPLQQATLILLGHFYADRDATEFNRGESRNAPRLGEITLPRIVHFLLDPYHKPRLA